jgi:uncharacterized protein
MAGVSFFEAALKFQGRYLSGARVKNVIQTNGTMLSPNWVTFLLEHDFKVGVSLDGPKALHDAQRVTPRGDGSHDRIMANLVRARQLGLRFSVIATVNQANVHAPDEIFQFFLEHGFTSFGFNMVYECGPDGRPTDFSISNAEYADFQRRIFDLWLARNDRRVRIRHIDSIVQGLLGLPSRSCIYAGTCQRFISINSNGDIFPCERLTEAPRLGNLYEARLGQILQARPYSDHVTMTEQLPMDCRSCRFLNICRNGCTHHRTRGKLYFCEGRKAVFRHIESAIEKVTSQAGAGSLMCLPVAPA